MQTQQLALGLSLKEELTFANFLTGSNQEILAALKKVAVETTPAFIYLCHSGALGASHLLQATCHAAHHAGQSAAYLPLADWVQLNSEMLQGFEMMSVVCLDDLQVIAGKPQWEEAVFHLYNRIQERGGRLVVAANDIPKNLRLGLPDLVSRLTFGVLYQMHPLTDDEKIQALKLRAEGRGITLADEVARYILTHCPRHMGTLFAALDALDKASLAEQRRLTIPFVKAVLQI